MAFRFNKQTTLQSFTLGSQIVDHRAIGTCLQEETEDFVELGNKIVHSTCNSVALRK